MLKWARNAMRLFLALAAILAFVTALIWPWPAPEVDWRTPLDAALANDDCASATAILNAAIGGGSIEALDERSTLAERAMCFRADASVEVLAKSMRFWRNQSDTPIDAGYGLDEDALGFWRYYTSRTAAFLCVVPYDNRFNVDSTEISAALPDKSSWIMAWHRQRRAACVTVLAQMATSLADDDDIAAKQAAYDLAMRRPLGNTLTSRLVLATLLLDQRFVPKWLADGGEEDIQYLADIRDLAWSELGDAAASGHQRAIRMMIALLHEGRLRARDDRQAYFWILRNRRLGGMEATIDAEIERGLTNADRLEAKRREASDWDVSEALLHIN
ncbi:MAG: hypothetical protein K8S25_02060 [Alphaproteobacteria bacterium]|nr:hypothetical protein [Alphaproteobacteria bacterium]